MSIRTLASFAVAILLGLGALFLLRNYLVSHSAAQVEAKAGVPVVVAVAPISRGAPLTVAMFKVARYPHESVPQGAFTSVDQLLRSPDGAPRTAVREMVVNEPVVASKVSGPGSQPNLAGVLAPGMRAVSVKSSDVAGVGGFILPGDRVDVLVTRQTGKGEQASSLVQVLAENVRVMGVDQSSDTDKPTVAKAVTMEVTSDQAQAISLAQAVGAVTLALRQANDATALTRRVMKVSDLIPQPQAPRRISRAPRLLQPVRAKGADVRVTRGVEVATYAMSN